MSAKVVLGYIGAGAEVEEIRGLLRSLLARLLGTTEDRPLAGLVGSGQTVVIKPNMVRHFNPSGPLAAVVTSPLVVRVLVEAAYEEVGPAGHVVVADSPQNDCEFSALLATEEWSEVLAWAQRSLGAAFEVLDMRPEEVTMRDGIVVERRRLPGDPKGEVVIDLSGASAFVGSGLEPSRLRGSDYDPSVTTSSHSGGCHRYSVCRTFLDADLLIVVPKVKTHKKVGLSLAMKNLVGMVGEKNCLPHHTAGFAGHGGDEYPKRTLHGRTRQWGAERARTLLAHNRGVRLLRAIRRAEGVVLPEIVTRSGNWWGNDTAWRMVVDLVDILGRSRRDTGMPTVFVYDGLVVGEGEGPLAPEPVNFGLLAASEDPVAGDIAVAGELGVEPEELPLLHQARVRGVWDPERPAPVVERTVGARPDVVVRMHPGWSGRPAVAPSP
ncbi:MAG: DUF362 domain-containing protein [Acidimicrobiales bacterium]